jgi:hypothetical protein
MAFSLTHGTSTQKATKKQHQPSQDEYQAKEQDDE